jgi:hypothetical protein
VVPTCFIIFYVLSFKILKKNPIILPCDTVEETTKRRRRRKGDETYVSTHNSRTAEAILNIETDY